MLTEFYTHPQEVWDKKTCDTIARHKGRDGCGTVHPYPGQINADSSPYPRHGQARRYNGGCIRNGIHYAGEAIPLPKIPPGFGFIHRTSWGTYLVKNPEKPLRHDVAELPSHA